MLKISFEPEIYTYQIDFAHHVSNIVYIEWMEIGRLKLLAAIGLAVHEVETKGFTPVLTATEIAYKKPLVLGDGVRVELWLSDLQNASATMDFQFYRRRNSEPETLSATGKQKGVFINLQTGRLHRLSPEDRARFEPYLDLKTGSEQNAIGKRKT